jgi:hypothetical protein
VNWALHNPDESDTWATYANARHHGSKSIRVDNFYYDAAGGYDELILPNVDLRTMTNPKLSFDYSYAYYNATATQNDSMEILLSIDCGITWESLFYAGATAPATTQSFRPANTSQWNVDTIDLSFWSAESNVIMKFRNIGYYQNNLYLDDINVSGDSLITLNTGFPNLSENSFRIYPNPTSDRIFIDWSSLSEIKKLDVINLLGETVFTTDEFSSRIFSINLSSFSKGLYTVKAMTDGGTFSKRVILQ